jgi:hypothetical protein
MKKFFIDLYTIKHWQQGYTLEVGSMRPPNAPKQRYTKSDRERRAYVAKINYGLAMSEKYFQSIDEIKQYIDELNE